MADDFYNQGEILSTETTNAQFNILVGLHSELRQMSLIQSLVLLDLCLLAFDFPA